MQTFTPTIFPQLLRVRSLDSKNHYTDLNSYVHYGTYRPLREREDLDTEEKERRRGSWHNPPGEYLIARRINNERMNNVQGAFNPLASLSLYDQVSCPFQKASSSKFNTPL